MGAIVLIFQTAYLAYFVSAVVTAEGVFFNIFELVICVQNFIYLSMVLVSLALSTIYGTGKNFRGGNWYYERAAM